MRKDMIKIARAARRKQRVRKKVTGTPERPRLAVSRSHRNISAQIIDDLAGRTLCAVDTRAADLRDQVNYGGNRTAAAVAGKLLAEKAKQAGVELVSFDRRGCKFHGRIKALADAAREAGLKF